MSEEEAKLFVRPSFTLKSKKEKNVKGYKGVGATFLAYGFNDFNFATKQNKKIVSGCIRSGKKWAYDNQNFYDRPRIEATKLDTNFLDSESSGTIVRINFLDVQEPRLSRFSDLNAKSWATVLQLKTPLGLIDLTTDATLYCSDFFDKIQIEVKVRDIKDDESELKFDKQRFPYITTFATKFGYKHFDIADISVADTKEYKNPIEKDKELKKFYNSKLLYSIYDLEELLKFEILDDLSEDQLSFCKEHKVCVYASMAHSTKFFDQCNMDIIGENNFDKRAKRQNSIVTPGFLIATSAMIQGSANEIKLTKSIGHQKQAQVVIHFDDLPNDLGRKTFKGETKDICDIIATRSLEHLRKFRKYLESDEGNQLTLPMQQQHKHWLKSNKDYSKSNVLNVPEFLGIKYLSIPRKEQDVIAIFHQMIGSGFFKGYNFITTDQNSTYDSIFEYVMSRSYQYSKLNHISKLGISYNDLEDFNVDDQVLEYKYDLVALFDDFENDDKNIKHVDLAVCWEFTFDKNSFDYNITSYLLDEEEASEQRQYYGSTHFCSTNAEKRFEIIVLKELLSYLSNHEQEIVRQRDKY